MMTLIVVTLVVVMLVVVTLVVVTDGGLVAHLGVSV